MRRGQSGTAPGQKARRTRPVSSVGDSDREWLSSLFDALERTESTLDTLLALKTRRMAKAREAGLPTFIRRNLATAPSPGRRLEDLSRGFGGMNWDGAK